MLFVRVGNYHINVEAITAFKWSYGKLIVIDGTETPFEIDDKDKYWYKYLCEFI